MGYNPKCSTCIEIKNDIEKDNEDVRRATAKLESLLGNSILREGLSLAGMTFSGAAGVAYVVVGQITKAAAILVAMGMKALADSITGISSDITRAEDEQKRCLEKQQRDIERQRAHSSAH